jgi:7,8-dihydropterin-6-yl-methyl-4-(beta-D-ribofuranosyl)aminobenzene 5'-phosphate synthase
MAWRKLAGIALLAALSGPAVAEKTAPEIVLLSTMVASFLGEGEWGFSALITTPSDTILFDTGFKADTVASNARLLGIDLSVAESVVLTHFHSDHTGGLLTLRRSLRARRTRKR